MNPQVTANGKETEAKLPCSIEEFLVAQKLPTRSVVVEHNGEAVAPSEFSGRMLKAGDRLEIVKIVAGGVSGGGKPAAIISWAPRWIAA